MISRCYYSSDSKSVYKDDNIIRIDRPPILKKHVVIFHNTPLMVNQDFYRKIISKLPDYKIVYTSEPKKVMYGWSEPPGYTSKFNLGDINSILEYLCVQSNCLYVVLLISNDQNQTIGSNPSPNIWICDLYSLNLSTEECTQLESKIFGYKMTITQTSHNLEQLVNNTYEYDTNCSDIVIFIQSTKIYNSFSNWLKWSFNGFEAIQYHIDLKYNTKPDLYAQFICLKNSMCDITIETFPDIKKKFLHSLNYLNLIPKDELDNLSQLVSSANCMFNVYQNNVVHIQLEQTNSTNLPDNLFLKSFKTTPNYMTTKQSKTFVSNRIRSEKLKLDQLDLLDLTDLETNNLFIKSLDQIVSPISLSSWYDEYLSKSCLGLLVKIESEYSDKMGWTCDTIKTNITNTLIGREQIYDGHEFFWQKNSRLDNGKMEQSLISGSAIGSGNSMIPLYINQYHWIWGSKYLEELVSIGITQNPYLFKPIMFGVYAHVLLGLISDQIQNGSTYNGIRTICWVIQTIKKIQKLNSDNMWDHDTRVSLVLKFLEWIDKNEPHEKIFDSKFIFNTYEEITKRNMRKEFKTKKDILGLVHIEILNQAINKDNIQEFENLCVFVSIIQPSQINQLLESAENSFGWIGDDLIDPIKNTIKSNNKFFKLSNMFEILLPSIDPNISIKLFTYQSFLSRVPKLQTKLEQTIGILDLTNQTACSIDLITKHMDLIMGILD